MGFKRLPHSERVNQSCIGSVDELRLGLRAIQKARFRLMRNLLARTSSVAKRSKCVRMFATGPPFSIELAYCTNLFRRGSPRTQLDSKRVWGRPVGDDLNCI